MNKAAVSKIGFFSGLALFCIIFFLDEIPGLSRSGQITLCVFLLMGIWWATEALPLPITSLMPLVLFPILGVEEIGVISKEYMKKMGENNIYHNFKLKFEIKILSHVFVVALCSLQCTKK